MNRLRRSGLFRFWELGGHLGMSRMERLLELYRRPIEDSVALFKLEGAIIAAYEQVKLARAGGKPH